MEIPCINKVILSYPILSYPILSYPILSYPILSYPILSYPILSYPILSYPYVDFAFWVITPPPLQMLLRRYESLSNIKHSTVLLTDLSATDEFGRTALHNAILGKHLRIVQMLLSKGANVQVQDERGDTPLHTAVRVGDEKILQVR